MITPLLLAPALGLVLGWRLPDMVSALMHAPHPPLHRERMTVSLVAAGVAATFAATSSSAMTAVALVAIPLAWIDLFEQRLPHDIVLPMIPVTLLVSSQRAPSLVAAVVTVLIFGVGVLILGLGAGDATTAGLLAVALAPWGVDAILAAVILAFAMAAAVAGVGLMRRRTSRHDAIAFGPALLLGAGMVALISG